MEALGIILSGQLVRVAVIVLLERSFVMQLVDFTWKESLNAFGNGYEFGNGNCRDYRRGLDRGRIAGG